MGAFLLVMLTALIFNILVELNWMTMESMPRRTPVTVAWSLAFHIALLVWVAVLLARRVG